jgi:hypothetical protein
MEDQSGDCCGVAVIHRLRRFAPFENSGQVFANQRINRAFFSSPSPLASSACRSVKNGAEQPTEIRNELMIAHSYANTVVVKGVYCEKGSAGGKRYSRLDELPKPRTWARSPPPLPTIFLMGRGLAKRGGKRGQITSMIRFVRGFFQQHERRPNFWYAGV